MRGWALAWLALPFIVACGDRGGGGDPSPTPIETGRLTIHLVIPPVPNPFAALDAYCATVLDSSGGVVITGEFGVNDEILLGGLGSGQGLTFVLEGLTAGVTVSRGTTLPFDLTETFEQTASLYFARTNTFSDVSGGPAARTGAAVVRLSDGRVLIAGGEVLGSARITAEIYDPATDTLTRTVGDMNKAHAGAPGVLIAPDVVLIAGGRDDGGAETNEVDLFVYDAAAGTGTWASVDPMSQSLVDSAVVPLGNGRALVAGGGNAVGLNPRSETEVFSWDGANGTGTWQSGPNMAVERMRLVGIPGAPGEAYIAGGFTDGGGTNAWDDGIEHYTFDLLLELGDVRDAEENEEHVARDQGL